MTNHAFTVQKLKEGTSYRILDPLGFPARAVNDFLEHLEIRGRSAYTLHSYATGLADFLGWLQGADMSIDDVTRHVIGQYVTEFGNGPNVRRSFPRKSRRPSNPLATWCRSFPRHSCSTFHSRFPFVSVRSTSMGWTLLSRQ